jgi:ketosteroid isomerase-like protein
MRSVLVIFLIVLCSITLLAQDADAKLASDLEALHTKWFKAFDSGDGATMDQIEVDKLVLVMPTGFIWTKTKARAGEQPKRDPETERALSNASVRRFGDTAILTGILTTKSGKENSQEATTVVFVRNSGKWKIVSAQWSPVTEADKTR